MSQALFTLCLSDIREVHHAGTNPRSDRKGSEARRPGTSPAPGDHRPRRHHRPQTGYDDSRVSYARTLAAIGGAAALLVIGTGWLGYDKGHDAGVASGYASARDEKVAVDWANTTNGKLARQLDRASPTVLPMILGCTGKNWKRTKQDGRRVCFPAATDGWWLP